MTKEQALANKQRVQEEGKQAWLKTGVGILELATGSGKTKIALDCLDEINHAYLSSNGTLPQVLIVVPTEEMRDIDWPAESEKWNIPLDNCKLVCYATLGKIDLSKYDLIIYDECHRLTLPNLRNLENLMVQSGHRTYVLGLTATVPKVQYEDDAERVHLLLSLLPSVYKLTTDEAVELGLISDFHVHVLKFNLDGVNKNIPAGTKLKPFLQSEEMTYRYLTKRLQLASIAAQSNPSKQGFKFSAISARMQFLYNLPSKLRLATMCMNRIRQDEQTRTIVFAGSIEQANKLCGENVYHSESNRDALERFQNREINLLGAVRALNEGKNLTEPDNGLIIQVDSVDRNLVQRIGRLVRIRYDKMDHKATVIILVAADTADEKWYRTAIQYFETKRITETLVRVPATDEL